MHTTHRDSLVLIVVNGCREYSRQQRHVGCTLIGPHRLQYSTLGQEAVHGADNVCPVRPAVIRVADGVPFLHAAEVAGKADLVDTGDAQKAQKGGGTS